MITAHALRASHTTFRKPSKTNTITDLEILDRRSNSLDTSDDLMTGNQWVCREAPFIAKHAQIRMANTTILDADIDMLGLDGRQHKGVWREWRTRLCGSVGVDGGHEKKTCSILLANDSSLTRRNEV